jgi:hypothetical protein
MEIFLGISGGLIALVLIILFVFEYRIRQPDILVLFERKGQLSIRSGMIYPRHFSLPLKRTTHSIQVTVQATAAGNLGVNIKLAGSVAPALDHLQTLIRIGGWNKECVEHASTEVCIFLEGLVKEYTERSEIHLITSAGVLEFLNDRSDLFKEKFGVELISLAVQSLEAADTEIADALRQQEQARLLEQTEKLNHMARVAAAKAKYQADEEIAEMDHALELKKADLEKDLFEQESLLAQQRVEDELNRSRMRLTFEKEELEILKNNPELLVLTPQAARLVEAGQGLKNARTVISLTPQDFTHGSELLNLFQEFLQKALNAKKSKAEMNE